MGDDMTVASFGSVLNTDASPHPSLSLGLNHSHVSEFGPTGPTAQGQEHLLHIFFMC